MQRGVSVGTSSDTQGGIKAGGKYIDEGIYS